MISLSNRRKLKLIQKSFQDKLNGYYLSKWIGFKVHVGCHFFPRCPNARCQNYSIMEFEILSDDFDVFKERKGHVLVTFILEQLIENARIFDLYGLQEFVIWQKQDELFSKTVQEYLK